MRNDDDDDGYSPLLFLWLQQLQLHRGIYNVANKHQCHVSEAERRRAAQQAGKAFVSHIVRPFALEENFYGCLECGKYHVCQLRETSCPLVYSESDKEYVCLYSGRAQPQSLALEWADEQRLDQNHSVTLENYSQWSTRHDHVLYRQMRLNERFKRRLESLRRAKRARSDDKKPLERVREKKEKHGGSGMEIQQDFTKLKTSLERPPPSKRPRAAETGLGNCENDPCAYEVKHRSKRRRQIRSTPVGQSSSDPLELYLTEEEQEEEEEEEEKPVHALSEKKEKTPEQAVCVDTEKVKYHAAETEESVVDGSDAEEADHRDYDRPARPLTSDEAAKRAKNYHNNLAYWNDYYSFLEPFWQLTDESEDDSQEQQQEQKVPEEDVEKRDLLCDENGLFLAQLHRPAPAIAAEVRHYNYVMAEKTKEKLTKETMKIIGYLLLYQLVTTTAVAKDRPLAKLETEDFISLLERIGGYYTNVVVNITALVYASSETRRLSEMTMRPLNICHALLSILLLEKYVVEDARGQRIYIWSSDSWLTSLDRVDLLRPLIHDIDTLPSLEFYYYSGVADDEPPQKYLLLERLLRPKQSQSRLSSSRECYNKELNDCANVARSSLDHYTSSPLWLRRQILGDQA